MPNTYTPIGNITFSARHPLSAIFTFNNIPQGYTDLVAIVSGQSGSTTADDIIVVYFQDGGSTSNYNYVQLGANGNDSSLYSSFTRNANGILAGNLPIGSNTQNDWNGSVWNFMNYSNSSTWKNVMVRDSQSTRAGLPNASTVGVWRNTAAITSISFRTVNGTGFKDGTKINFYGVTKA